MNSVLHHSDSRPGTCHVRILEDVPTKDDSLHSLKHVVEAIARVVESPEQKGGKGIMLEGTWGSGKSSVVKMLRERYSGNDGVKVVVYDAWGHQGDPLRRSFIESLIDSLSSTRRSRPWTSRIEWTSDLAELSRRDESSTSRVSTRLTGAASHAAVGALFLGPGVALLAEGFRSAGDVSLLCSIMEYGSGVVLSLAPLLLGLVGLRRDIAQWKSDTRREECKSPRPSLSTVFAREQNQHVESHSYKTADPTSLEFCEKFHKVMSTVLTGGERSERKLLLVIDNLDRVATHDALALWSTMRSIFEESDSSRPEWLDRVWLLVPIDRASAERLWRRDACPFVQEGDKRHELKKDDGQHFLNKTFQARFRIPHPSLSGWSCFLGEKLAEAIPCCARSEEVATIVRLFDLLTPEAPLRITPRLIIQYVNRLASLHAVWMKDIPLATQAAYLLTEDNIRQTPEILARGIALTPTALSLLDREWWDSDFARMHYSVRDRAQAAEIVLWDATRNALCENDHKVLDGLKEHTWFARVVQSVVGRDSPAWTGDNGATLTNSSLGLAYVDAEGDPKLFSAWKALAARPPARWLRFGQSEGQGLVEIMRHNSLRLAEIAPGLVRSFSGRSEINIATGSTEQASEWLKGALEVIRYLAAEHSEFALGNGVSVPLDAQFYIKTMDALAQIPDGHLHARYFVPQTSEDEVVNILLQDAQSGKLADLHARAVHMMVLVDRPWSLTQLATSLPSRVRAAVAAGNAAEADACISILTDVVHRGGNASEAAASNLAALVREGYVASCLYVLCANKRLEGAARCVYTIFDYQPAGDFATAPQHSSDGKSHYEQFLRVPDTAIAEHFAFLVKSYMKLTVFAERVQRAKPSTLAKYVLEKIGTEDEATTYFGQGDVQASLSFLQSVFGESCGEFLGRLSSLDAIVEDAISRGFRTTDSGMYILYLAASTNRPVSKNLAEFLREAVSGLTKDVWLAEIRQPTDLSRLAPKMVESGICLNDDSPLMEALQDHAEEAAKKGSKLSPRWDDLRAVLTPDERNDVDRKVLKYALSQDSTSSGRRTVLQAVESHMKTQSGISVMADEVVLYYANRTESAGLDELKWLAQAFKDDISPSRASADLLRNNAEGTLKSSGLRYDIRLARQAIIREIDAWLSRH